MEETMSLYEILQLLKKRMKLIAMVSLAAVICAAIFSYFFLPEVYQTSTQILVNQESTEESQVSNMTIETDLQLIHTYSAMINSPVIVDQVIEQLNLTKTFEELNQQITVESIENSQLLKITATDSNPAAAVSIANKTAEVLQKETQELMNVNNIIILSTAKVPINPLPVEPSPLMTVFLAAIAGLIVGIGLSFAIEYLDTSIKNGQEIRELLDVPLIGSISAITIEKERKVNDTIPFKKKGV